MSNSQVEGLGSVAFWGFSPAIDFWSVCKKLEDIENDINIFLVGSSDARHIMKTLSRRFASSTGKPRKINFFVLENSIEQYGRLLLQHLILVQNLRSIGLQDKTELFLDLYGNLMVRKQCLEFASNAAKYLIEVITDMGNEEWLKLLPGIDLSLLKYKQRDSLESLFKLWIKICKQSSTSSASSADSTAHTKKLFDAKASWDFRLRRHLGRRYDGIPNVFDWDVSMVLNERCGGGDGGKALYGMTGKGPILNSREYTRWRHYGQAFELRDSDYNADNATLTSARQFRVAPGLASLITKNPASGGMIASNDMTTTQLTYSGDLTASPYIAFGLESDNEELFRKQNNTFIRGSIHVSEYNLCKIFYEFQHGHEYKGKLAEHATAQEIQANKTGNGQTVKITEIVEEDEEEEDQTENRQNNSNKQKTQNWNLVEYDGNYRIVLLPLDALSDVNEFLSRRIDDYTNKFQICCFSASMAHQLGKPEQNWGIIRQMLTGNGQLLVETPKFMPEVSDDQIKAYSQGITESALAHGFKPRENEQSESTEIVPNAHLMFDNS